MNENLRKQNWEVAYGRDYWWEDKERFAAILKLLDEKGLIGQVVVDVGAGAHPVSVVLTPNNHKIIEIDMGGENKREENKLSLKYDIEKLIDESFTTKKTLIRTAKFLSPEKSLRSETERIDTIIFSDILNYVDYETVIKALSKYLKNQGRIMLFEMPGRGYKNMHSKKGLKNNLLLIEFLKKNGFIIEAMQSLPTDKKINLPLEEIILVARKSV